MWVGRTLGFLVLALALLTAVTAQAQPALPSVDPAACQIAPVSIPTKGEEGDLSTPAPTPTPISPAGAVAADDATAAAVVDTISQSIACLNAGDRLRMLATFSDRWIAQLFSGYDLVYYDQFVQQAALPATPASAETAVELVSISDIRIRDDGAALARVTTNVNGVEQRSLLLLIQEDGRWKIDGAESVS